MPIANWSGDLGPCRLVRHTGETWTYESLDALVQKNRNILINNMLSDRPSLLCGVKPKNEYIRTDDHLAYRQYTISSMLWARPWYVILDELDLVVPPWKAMERAYQLRVFWRNPYYFNGHCWTSVRGRNYEFRNGPVPGTGHSGGRYRCYMRFPQTTAERRQYARDFVDEDLKDYPHLRLKNRHLPHSYDDVFRKPQKSWKKQRKTQWRSS